MGHEKPGGFYRYFFQSIQKPFIRLFSLSSMFIAAVALTPLRIHDSSQEFSLKLKLPRFPKGIGTKIKRRGESAVSLLITSVFSSFQLQELNEG